MQLRRAPRSHELAEAHRWTVDETHDPTIGCQARGGCKGCVARLTCRANLRLTTRLSNRGSQWRGIEIHSYSHTSPQDQLHSPQPTRAGALKTSIILDGGPHGWVPVNTHNTPVLVGAHKAQHPHETITKGMEGPFTTWWRSLTRSTARSQFRSTQCELMECADVP